MLLSENRTPIEELDGLSQSDLLLIGGPVIPVESNSARPVLYDIDPVKLSGSVKDLDLMKIKLSSCYWDRSKMSERLREAQRALEDMGNRVHDLIPSTRYFPAKCLVGETTQEVAAVLTERCKIEFSIYHLVVYILKEKYELLASGENLGVYELGDYSSPDVFFSEYGISINEAIERVRNNPQIMKQLSDLVQALNMMRDDLNTFMDLTTDNLSVVSGRDQGAQKLAYIDSFGIGHPNPFFTSELGNEPMEKPSLNALAMAVYHLKNPA